MKKALVTGGCGFIGSHIIRDLLAEGVEVVALDVVRAEPRFGYRGKARFVGADITDKESLRRVLDSSIDCVFHTAALFREGIPKEVIYKINVLGTRNLCEVLVEKGAPRLINWGSASAYGFWDDSNLVKDETYPVNEDDLVSTYASSKWEQEKVGEEFISKNLLQVTTVRPSNVYGPDTPNGITLPLYMFKIGLLRSIPGFREVFISHVHVDDVAGAVVHLAQTPQAVNQTYNITDNTLLSNIEIMELMTEVFHTWALPHRKKTFGIPVFHTPPPILWFSGILEEWRAKLSGQMPRFDRISALYATKNLILTNKKLLATGYRLKWPDMREVLPKLVEHYEQTDWAILK
ncbi:MAG: NAD(P)-dependent oxidoreductase [Elusimicrobia bacterium]|nr:NAD(P)-dependent oxidoreductase [Elusimicrobiota bacterium]